MSKSKDEITVLSYLEKMNRPYSINDIVQNLHNTVTKASAQKTLDKLVSDGKVKEKVYNKQKIYCIHQKDDENTNTAEMLKTLELQIIETTGNLSKLEDELKLIESELGGLQSSLTTQEATDRREKLQSAVTNLEEKFSKLSQDKIVISKSEKDKIEKDYETTLKAYRKRKRICMDILNSILENYPKSKAALIEEIGLEMDDDNNTPAILKT